MNALSLIASLIAYIILELCIKQTLSKIITPLYLSKTGYRQLEIVDEDFSSANFFSKFQIDMISGQNDFNDYYRQCSDGSYFGFFQKGKLTSFLLYKTYGSVSISFNLLLMEDNLNMQEDDKIKFYLNNELIQEVYLTNITNSTSTFSYKTTNCGIKIYSYFLNLKQINTNAKGYFPLSLVIETDFSLFTNNYWGLKDFYIEKVNCPSKCSVCNSTECIGCEGEFHTFTGSKCDCTTENDRVEKVYDYANLDEAITCKKQYVAIFDEDYINPLSKFEWIWNDDKIYPYYFQTYCSLNNLKMFGGLEIFGDGDVLNKVIKFSDTTYYTIPRFSTYKLDLTAHYFEWTSDERLRIIPYTNSDSITMNFGEEKSLCEEGSAITYRTESYTYAGLFDTKEYANITLKLGQTESRLSNNFALSKFTFSISPCHISCETCSNPSALGCLTCRDRNSILNYGRCNCKSGYTRDDVITNDFVCVKSSTSTIIRLGEEQRDSSIAGYADFAIINHNIPKYTRICDNTRGLIGGAKSYPGIYSHITLVVQEKGKKYYMKRFTLEVITEEDNLLLYQFIIEYNGKLFRPSKIFLKQAYFEDDIATSTNNKCYTPKFESTYVVTEQIKSSSNSTNTNSTSSNSTSGNSTSTNSTSTNSTIIKESKNTTTQVEVVNKNNLKLYRLEHLIVDISSATNIRISNAVNSFWGIYSFSIDYYECHINCNKCYGSTRNDCLQCSAGMIINQLFYNVVYKQNTYSCECDMKNGYFKVSKDYNPLECSNRIDSHYYFDDLNEDILSNKDWRGFSSLIAAENIISCPSLTALIIGYVGKHDYLERTMLFSRNFEYHSFNFNFTLYQFNINTKGNFLKISLDGYYVYGQNIDFLPKTIICQTNENMYSIDISFTVYVSSVYENMNVYNPTMVIEYFPNSQCSLNSMCGWGINRFLVKANVKNDLLTNNQETLVKLNSNCIENSVDECKCFPLFYLSSLESDTNGDGEDTCIQCENNCLECVDSTSCDTCMPGYGKALPGSSEEGKCILVNLSLAASQQKILNIDLQRYYSNYNYLFKGFSLTVWVQMKDLISGTEKPIIAADPYLITYNTVLRSLFHLKYTNFNSQYWKADEFIKVLNYPVKKETVDFYEKEWLPISMSLSVSDVNNSEVIFVQFSIHTDNAKSIHFDKLEIQNPKRIILFNYFSQIKYRNLKFWDRFIPIKELRQQNYMFNYNTTPEDLLLYYKLIEGKFNNLGTSNLIYVHNRNSFIFEVDTGSSPNFCLENQYYDLEKKTCSYCHLKCQNCYGPKASECFKCKYPYKYKNANTNTCEQMCNKDSFPNFRYSNSIPCVFECPAECTKCNRILGCIECIPGYMLYQAKCIKKCLPEIATSIFGCIENEDVFCVPKLRFLNPPDFFFLDGSNFKLDAQVTKCNREVSLTWESTIEDFVVESNENDNISTLILKSDLMSVPGYQVFSLLMKDSNKKLIDSQTIKIPFVKPQINGGIIQSYYLNQNITFSLKFFHDNVIKKSSEPAKYVWTCPYWVPFKECNPRMNTPEIVVQQNKITIGDGITYDTLVSAKCNVTQGQNSWLFVGFIVIYHQYRLEEYLDFTIRNSTFLGLNNDLSFYIQFSKKIDEIALKRDLSIFWGIDSVDYYLVSSDSLPYVSYKPVVKDFKGTVRVSARVVYRKNTVQEKTVERELVFTLEESPLGGTFSVTPLQGVSLVTTMEINSQKWVSTKFSKLLYMYFYEDPFGFLQPIYNKKMKQTADNIGYRFDYNATSEILNTIEENNLDNIINGISLNEAVTDEDSMGETLEVKFVPPTSKIVHRLYYGNDNSFIQLTKNVSYDENLGANFNEVDELFEYSISPTIQQLEVYSLNFRSEKVISKQEDIENYGEIIAKKLYRILANNFNLTEELEGELLYNVNKFGIIVESVSHQLLNYELFVKEDTTQSRILQDGVNTDVKQVLKSQALAYLIESIDVLYKVVDKHRKYLIFSKPYFANTLRAIDNILLIFNNYYSGLEIYNSKIFKILEKIINYTSFSTQVGLDRIRKFSSFELVEKKINTLFMQKSLIIHSNIGDRNNGNNNRANQTEMLISDYYLYNTSSGIDLEYEGFFNEDYEVKTHKSLMDYYFFIEKDVLQSNYIELFAQLSAFNFNNVNVTLFKNSPNKITPIVDNIVNLKILGKNVNPEYLALHNNTNNTSNNATTNSTKSLRFLQDSSNNNTNKSNITLADLNNNKSNSIHNLVDLPSYYNNSKAFNIYFRLKDKFNSEILSKSTCAIYNSTTESYMEDLCNTWFDYSSYFVLCECDIIAPVTVIFDPNFVYARRLTQFPQKEEDLLDTWGMSTIIFLTGLFVLFALHFYLKDKRELAERNNKKIKNSDYTEFRGKMKSKLFRIKEVSFSNLYEGLVDHSNEYYSLNHLSDFYYLRVYRVLFFFLRLYSLILFCFYKQKYYLDPTVEVKVKNRDISIRDDRETVYNWHENYFVEIVNNLYYAIPISLVMIIFPKLAEWMFRYDEELLRYKYYSNSTMNVSSEYYNKKVAAYKLNEEKIKVFKNDQAVFNPWLDKERKRDPNSNNANILALPYSKKGEQIRDNKPNLNVEMSDMTKRRLNDDTTMREGVKNNIHDEYTFKKPLTENSLHNRENNDDIENPSNTLQDALKEKQKRNYLAYLNFMRMNFAILNDIRYQNFLNEKSMNYPESLAPLYSQRMKTLNNKYWSRIIEIKIMLHKEMQMDREEEKLNNFNVFKNLKKQITSLEAFMKGSINTQMISMTFDQDLKTSEEAVEKAKNVPSYKIKKQKEAELLKKLEQASLAKDKAAKKKLEERNKELTARMRYWEEVSYKIEFDREEHAHYERKNKYLLMTKGIAKLMGNSKRDKTSKILGSSLVQKFGGIGLQRKKTGGTGTVNENTSRTVNKLAGIFGVIKDSNNEDIQSIVNSSNPKIKSVFNFGTAKSNLDTDNLKNRVKDNDKKITIKEDEASKIKGGSQLTATIKDNPGNNLGTIGVTGEKKKTLAEKIKAKQKEREENLKKENKPDILDGVDDAKNTPILFKDNDKFGTFKEEKQEKDEIFGFKKSEPDEIHLNTPKNNNAAPNLININNNDKNKNNPDNVSNISNSQVYRFAETPRNKAKNQNVSNSMIKDDESHLQDDADIEKMEKEIQDLENEEEEEENKKDILAGLLVPSNALIPDYVYKLKREFVMIVIKAIIIILLIAVLIYFITKLIVSVKSNGGVHRAIFWIILAAIAIFENYIIIVPGFCLFKTFILKKYGNKVSKKISWKFRDIVYFLIISNMDRAVYQELKECVKNNLEREGLDKEQEAMFNYAYEDEDDKLKRVKMIKNAKTRRRPNENHDDDDQDNQGGERKVDDNHDIVSLGARSHKSSRFNNETKNDESIDHSKVALFYNNNDKDKNHFDNLHHKDEFYKDDYNSQSHKSISEYQSESYYSNYKVSEEGERNKDEKLKLFDYKLNTNQTLKVSTTNKFKPLSVDYTIKDNLYNKKESEESAKNEYDSYKNRDNKNSKQKDSNNEEDDNDEAYLSDTVNTNHDAYKVSTVSANNNEDLNYTVDKSVSHSGRLISMGSEKPDKKAGKKSKSSKNIKENDKVKDKKDESYKKVVKEERKKTEEDIYIEEESKVNNDDDFTDSNEFGYHEKFDL